MFNIFITEPLYKLSEQNEQNNFDDSYFDGSSLVEKSNENNSNPNDSKHNLRNVKFKLKREDPNFFIGSYTPEIINSLKLDGLDSTMIDDLVENFHQDDITPFSLKIGTLNYLVFSSYLFIKSLACINK